MRTAVPLHRNLRIRQWFPGGLRDREGGDERDERGPEDVESRRDGVAGTLQQVGEDQGRGPSEDGDRHAIAQREGAVTNSGGEELGEGGGSRSPKNPINKPKIMC